MTHYEEEDDRAETDIPAGEPIGKARVTFDVPMPTVEQVTGEIARQLISAEGYGGRAEIMKKARTVMDDLITGIILAKATPIIEELLSKPLQPTDNFGNPVGEPTSLQGVLAMRVTEWCHDLVDSEGKPAKRDAYNSRTTAPRIDWALGKIVNGEMKKQVDVEVNKIIATLKESATQNIAKQIAEKVSGLILK